MLLKRYRIYKGYRFSRSYNKNHIYGDVHSDKCNKCRFKDGLIKCSFVRETNYSYKKIVYPCTSTIIIKGKDIRMNKIIRSINYFYTCY